MARQEIIQKPIVKVIDDYDGAELPENTKSVRYQFNGRTYDLYLSEASRKAVDDFIAKLTDGAEEVSRAAAATRSSRRTPSTTCASGPRSTATRSARTAARPARSSGHSTTPTDSLVELVPR